MYVADLATSVDLRAVRSHAGWSLTGTSAGLTRTTVCLRFTAASFFLGSFTVDNGPCKNRVSVLVALTSTARHLAKEADALATQATTDPNTEITHAVVASTTSEFATYSAGGWEVHAATTEAVVCLLLPVSPLSPPVITKGPCASQHYTPLSAAVLAQAVVNAATSLVTPRKLPFFVALDFIPAAFNIKAQSDPYDATLWSIAGPNSTYACIAASLTATSILILPGACQLPDGPAQALLESAVNYTAADAQQQAAVVATHPDPNTLVTSLLGDAVAQGVVTASQTATGWTIGIGAAFVSPVKECMVLPTDPATLYTISPGACPSV
jgi:hypothetical protein